GEFIKILDFGLAKLMDTRSEGDEGLTQVGWAVGTPQWVSPEVMLGEDADVRSDIYGLGAVLYFLLCAQSPYGQHEISKVMRAHRKEMPKRPSIRISQPIHSKLEDVVMRCLDKDPNKRYQTAAELEVALMESVSPESPTEVLGPPPGARWRAGVCAESSTPTNDRNTPESGRKQNS
ncbi:MAG: protein kinase, partial [Myxococcales bacterium]|nr:protein kinase [Myxococcales bacterium]